ncbi:MAG: peptide deformylase [Candidatus Pacebacteria bacterium]|jgi:methionyl-tRNA formyltransferase|nr:peptide deformylase [Candidatus Paceibacterota bacterium]
MKIISAPHPTLRQVANPVEKFDKRLLKFIERLKKQLLLEKDPEGVGLAAPQVNKSWQIFILRNSEQDQLTAFINPKITVHSQKKTLLKENEHFEGCLSVPKIYGPVPRWDWLEIAYQSINNQGKVEERTEKYRGFLARVIQHEYDHLQGVLFTDHLLENDLPAYIFENNQWIELEDRQILANF